MGAGYSKRTKAIFGAAAIALAVAPGCVKRRYTIRTDPPGALVYVNGEEIGTTPISKSYTYYAPREIVLVADGYKTEKIIQDFPAPWWDNALTDFFSENLLPVTLRDEREFGYRMVPAETAAPNDVLARAQGMRQEAQIPAPPKRRTFFEWLGIR